MKLLQKYTLFTIVSLFFVACNHRGTSHQQVFYYNEARGVATLDPAFAKSQSVIWPVHQLFNTLMELDSNLNIVPSVAKRWTISPDNLTYTFYLRNDVYFQDNDAFPQGRGRRLTAADVAYSLERILDSKTASSGAWIFNGRIAPDGFRAIDDTTFQVKLRRPFHPVMGILTMEYCAIVPHEVVEKYGKDFGRHPCGSGPFQLKYWEDGQALVLEKNPHYWERDKTGKALPYLDAVNIRFYNNKATEFLQFRQGRLSFINDIDPSFKDEVINKRGGLRKQWEGKVVLQKHPYLNTEYLGILMDEQNPLLKGSPLKVKAVRQAINYAIDKSKLVMYLRNAIGLPATAGFVPGGLPSNNIDSVKGYHYDPQKALALLKHAGFADGRNLPAIKLVSAPDYADVASFVASQLEEVGIHVRVEVLQKSMILQQTAKSEASFFLGSWMADYPDAENYMAVFYSKNPAPPNYTRYRNAAFDALYERSLQERDDMFRNALYRQMDQMVIDDAPVVPLFYDEVIRLVQPGLRNFKPNALNLLALKKVYFAK